MTASQFVTQVEEYYGKYENDFMRKMVQKYVSGMDEQVLGVLLKQVMLSFSSQYGKVPDIAAIEKVLRDNKDAIKAGSGEIYVENGTVYRNGEMLGHYDGGRFVPMLAPIQGTALLEQYVDEFGSGPVSPERFAGFIDQVRVAQIEAPEEDE